MPHPPFTDADNYRARSKGFSGTAVASSTTNLDFAIGVEDRYMHGGELILKNHVFGDTYKFQVIDKDNVLGYGANTVLDEFRTDWNVFEDRQNQGIINYNFVARLYAGLYVRLVYTSTGGTNVLVRVNFLWCKKT
jgi:hypothetical protein